MKASIKGTLLSGLVFPGFGQISLGRKLVGFAIVGLTVAGMAGLGYGLARRLPPLVQQVMSETGGVSFSRLTELSMGAVSSGDWWLEKASVNLILLCWVCSTVHAFIVGQRHDQQNLNASRP